MTTQRWKILLAILLLIALVMPGSAVFAKGPPDGSGGGGGGGGGDHGPPDVEASNNLSWPLLQPDEVKLFSEPLPFTAVKTADCWDFDTDFECEYFCETTDCPEPLRGYDADDYGHAFDPIPLYEQGVGNLWRADYSLDQSPTKVALIDWGDNLEAKDWRLGAMIRVEVRLKGELADQTMIYYPMYHMFGEGVTERWGTSYDPTSSDLEWTTDKPYIYANGARLLIQEVVCDDPVWNGERWKCEGTDMPVVYEDDMSTEVNIGGYAIYGFRWVTRDCRAAGTCRANMDYRLTFSLPTESSTNPSNVQISKTGGTIIEIAEEEPTDEEDPHAASITEEPGGNQAEVGEGYTWIDVMLTQGGGGKKTRSLDMELEMEQERECDQSCDCAFECDGDGICEQECEQEYQELHNQNGDDDVQGQGDQEQERERERERSNMHLFLPFVTNQ